MNTIQTIQDFIQPRLNFLISEVQYGFAGSLFIQLGEITKTTRITPNGKMLTRRTGEATLFLHNDWWLRQDGKVLADYSLAKEALLSITKVLLDQKIEQVQLQAETLHTVFILTNALSVKVQNPTQAEAEALSHAPDTYFAWSYGCSVDKTDLYVGPGSRVIFEYKKHS